mmetsp:Transcript_13105/g.39668  ORF Transcript_13105/g.39668 Transcript_13105/m.39668 type:complete len:1026 (-) Transcript_13105:2008-5085(-)
MTSKNYAVRVQVPYATKWGQSVRLVLSNEAVAQASSLQCQHIDGQLIWAAQLSWPKASHYTYTYVVVNEAGTVEDEETRPRTVAVPDSVPLGGTLHLVDEWQDKSDPGNILATTAFRSVIFSGKAAQSSPAEAAPDVSAAVDGSLLRLCVWDWGIAEGEAVHIVGSLPALGALQQADAPRMVRMEGPHWQLEVPVTAEAFPITYNYMVVDGKGVGTIEEGGRRTLQQPEGVAASRSPSTIEEKSLAGAADDKAPVASDCAASPVQQSDSEAPPATEAGEKLGIPTIASLSLKDSEEANDATAARGDSSRLAVLSIDSTQSPAVSEEQPSGVLPPLLPALIVQNDGPVLRKVRWRGSGLAVPVFSLRTRRSVGVGEFLDIKRLVDVCCMAGMRLIQLLPVNDTSVNMMWWDSYPYSSLSVHALHPLYLSLHALSDDMPEDLQQQIDSAAKALTAADVDYDATMAAKILIARSLFDRSGAALLQTDAFKAWYEANKEWLQPYAVFCFLRDLFGSAEHWKWGSLSSPTQQDLDRISGPERDFHASIQFVYYVQYHLHLQLLDASQYAASHRVVLKGDLPIGVDKRSVDAWMHPSNFRMNVSTGAPPDMFAKMGQNWGFPTYQWNEMEKDGYSFWKRRLTHMSQYFHAYRIDHVLGFFRIWEIPGDCTAGLLGHFRPSIPIRRYELESHGIWDIDRLCEPYVTWALLQDTFGELAADVASKYFEENTVTHRYSFRGSFKSEAGIMAIKARKDSPEWLEEEVAHTRTGLMHLRQNVVLLHNPDEPDSFYPRIQMSDTSSFRELESGWRDRLQWLHDDYFFRRQEDLWRSNALRTLPALMGATDMMVCGEDLGMIPACVHPVMERLGLLGLRIQRMPSEVGQEFGDPAQYPYMVVCSPSCHDTSTTRAWWEEDAERRQRFAAEALPNLAEVPEHCTPEVMRSIVRQHLESPSMWCILPIQDVVALSPKYMGRAAAEETINDPTNPRHYWRYRIHYTVEDLLEDEPLLADLQALLLGSGRCNTEDLPELHTQ